MQALFKIASSSIVQARDQAERLRVRRERNSVGRATSAVIDGPSVTITDAPFFRITGAPSSSRGTLIDAQESDGMVISSGLLYSLAKTWSWAALAHRCETHPAEVSVFLVDREGESAAHWAVFGNPPLYAVEALIRACPDIVNVRNNGGNLPLHVACSYRASADVLRVLINANPKTAAIRNTMGFTPLHILCDYGSSEESIQAILETEEGARKVTAKDRLYGRKALDILNQRKTLEYFTARVKRLRNARQQERDAMLCGLWSDNDLRQLDVQIQDAKRSSYWSMARLLILTEYYQRPLTVRDYGDDNKDTVIACLAIEECPPSLLEFALLLYKDELMIADEKGNYPLHYACARKATEPMLRQWIVQEYVLAYPDAAKHPNNEGLYPLQIYLQSFEKQPPWSEVLKSLVFANLNAIWALPIDSRVIPIILERIASDVTTRSEIFNLIQGNPILLF
jgi:hypothetical protein